MTRPIADIARLHVKPGVKGFLKVDVRVRFEAKVDKSDGPNACWTWLGVRNNHDRGRFWFQGRMQLAPRVAWFLAHGEMIPDHLFACHKCDNPKCVNPQHLFVGTRSDNMLDAIQKKRAVPPPGAGWQKRLTHCKRGHPLFGDNLYFQATGNRGCRICHRMHDAKWRERRRAISSGTQSKEKNDG